MKKTRLNIRACLVMGAALALTAGAVHTLHGFQVTRHADFFRRQAEQAQKEKRAADAIAHYESYLNLKRGDPDALASFGHLLSEMGQNQRAYRILTTGMQVAPEREDICRQLVKVAIRIQRYSEARRILEEQLLRPHPADIELLGLLGQCQVGMRDYISAARSFEKSLQSDPHQVSHYLLLIDLLRDAPDNTFSKDAHWIEKNADFWADRMVEANPQSATAYVGRGLHRLYRKSEIAGGSQPTARAGTPGSLQAADEDARKALELEPKNASALWLMAQCALRTGRLDDARKFCKSGMEIASADPRWYTTLADVEIAARRPAEAVRWLEQGCQAAPADKMLPLLLARHVIDSANLETARKAIGRLNDKEYPAAAVAYLRGRVAFLEGRWLAATEQLLKARSNATASSQILADIEYWLAQVYRQMGNLDLELDACRRALAADPLSRPARQACADALTRSGRIDEAIEQIRGMPGQDTDSPSEYLQLTRLLVLRNLRLPPAQRNWSEVEKRLDRLSAESLAQPAVLVLKAELRLAQGRSQDAEEMLTQASKKAPDQVSFWVARVELAEQQRNWDRAKQLIDDATKRCKDSVALRVLQARTRVRSAPGGKPDGSLAELANNADGFGPSARISLWRGVLEEASKSADPAAALDVSRAIALKAPPDLVLWQQIFSAAQRGKDEQLAKKSLDRIREIEGEGAVWHYAQALRLGSGPQASQPGAPQEALRHLETARELRPKWPAAILLAAAIHDRQHDDEAALEDYLAAIDLGAQSRDAVQRAVQLLYQRQDYLKASQLLVSLESQSSPFSTELERLKSQVAERLGQLEDALGAARAAAEGSRNDADYVWLGHLLSIMAVRAKLAGRDAEAAAFLAEGEKSLLHARDLGKGKPGPWVGLVDFFVRTGRPKDAETAMDWLPKELPADQVDRTMAACNLLLGRPDDAARKYDAALRQTPEDPVLIRQVAEFCIRAGRPQVAEDGLRAICEGKIKTAPAEKAACRRFLAMSLRSKGGNRNLEDALALIETNLKASPKSVLDLRTKAILLCSHPSPSVRRQGREILESLLAIEKPGSEDTRRMAAQEYIRAGDWPGAVRHLPLLNDRGSLLAYVSYLLQQKQLSEAELRIDQLQRVAPNDPTVSQLRAELAFLSGRYDQALTLLNTLLQDKSTAVTPIDPRAATSLQLERFARQLKDAGSPALALRFLEPAEAALRRLAQVKPDNCLILAGYLVRQDRWDEAVRLAEPALKESNNPSQIAQVCVDFFNGSGGDEARLGRIEHMLSTALARHPTSPDLHMAMVDLRTRQRQWDAVEAVYREFLKGAPDNVTVLNNLAELLALRGQNLQEAESLVDRAIALAGPAPAILDTRAMVYLALGAPEKALENLQTVIAEEPRPNRYYHLARVLESCGKTREASEAMKKATALKLTEEQLHPLERQDFLRRKSLAP